MAELDAVKRAAENLKQLRQAAGLLQAELADRAELSQNYISELEGAKRQFSLQTMVKLCRALNCELADLLAGINPKA